MTARLLASSIVITIAMGLALKTCVTNTHEKNVQNWADYAPHGIIVEENKVFKPNCSGFSCGGGTVYSLSAITAESIRKDGIEFFKTLPDSQKGKNDTPLGEWKKYAPISLQIEKGADIMKVVRPHYWNGDGASHPASKRLETTIDEYSYYVSNRGAEPKIIISPEAQLIYIGWFD